MKIRFNNHNYETHIKFALQTRIQWLFHNYTNPRNMWLSHGDGCCDYWKPATPEDFMLDDGFKLEPKEGDDE